MINYNAQYFDPKATVESGQLFRYDKLGENDYIVYSSDKKCRIVKSGDEVILDSKDEDYFFNFFDLNRDYGCINNFLMGFDEIRAAAKYGKGIRILRQNLYECIISFIISANNNIPRIKGIIERLCKCYGKSKEDYYCFPELERLKDISSGEFRSLGAGFRDIYLAKTSKILAETDMLDILPTVDNNAAYKLLGKLSGVGPKVADCVMLFGLNRMDRFPVDVWMFRACSDDVRDTPLKISTYYSERYGEYAGVAQQYIFYYSRKK